MSKKKRMSTHFDFQVVDRDGSCTGIDHILLYAYTLPRRYHLIIVLLTQAQTQPHSFVRACVIPSWPRGI